MKTPPILAPMLTVVIIGGLVGWFASDLSAPSPRERGSQAREGRPADGAAASGATAGEVVLPRSGDGHFYADVTVDGVSSRMLIDTGASVLALTGDDAEAIGIHWQPDQIRPIARGAGGAVYGVPVTLDEVRLGDFEARGIAAVVIPEGLRVSLLGQSFLSRVERVRIEGGQMVLGG